MANRRADSTLESDLVKGEMFISDMDQDSLNQEVVTVERNLLKEISSLICMVNEEKETLITKTTTDMLARNLMTGLTRRFERKEETLGALSTVVNIGKLTCCEHLFIFQQLYVFYAVFSQVVEVKGAASVFFLFSVSKT